MLGIRGGVLARYAELVTSADKGEILRAPSYEKQAGEDLSDG